MFLICIIHIRTYSKTHLESVLYLVKKCCLITCALHPPCVHRKNTVVLFFQIKNERKNERVRDNPHNELDLHSDVVYLLDYLGRLLSLNARLGYIILSNFKFNRST